MARPLSWVPTAFFAEGVPFAMVMWVSGTMFKDLGFSDTRITVATGSIGIAWSLKPFWAAFLDMYRTKKFWVLSMEFFMAALLAGIGLALHLPGYFEVVVMALWALAFASATQDICMDGIYITTLDEKTQARWVGIQGMSWNVGRIFAAAGVVWFASKMKDAGRDPHTAWMCALLVGAVVMGSLGAYHYVMLPLGSIAERPRGTRDVVRTFVDSVRAFFQKESIWRMLLFVFLYRSGEGFLLVEAPLFLQAPLDQGGVGLTLGQKALIDGTVSTAVSILGGILGGAFVARVGLRRWLVVLAISMNVPHLCYVYLSHAVSPAHPLPWATVLILVTVEKFAYSFGFVGNMLYMMQQIAPGKYKMTHYAFATSLMNLVLVPTETLSGPLADRLGYKSFFWFVLVASIPSILGAWQAPFPKRETRDVKPADLEGAA
jgi:MFS transporter, PAT family, beta-lactamase induction signal transducer AmpG